MGTLASEARNFSWASLPPGAEFRLLLVTLRGPDQSRSANASAWTRECHSPAPTPAAGPRVHLFDIVGRAAGRAAPRTAPPWPGPRGLVFAVYTAVFNVLKDTGPADGLVSP